MVHMRELRHEGQNATQTVWVQSWAPSHSFSAACWPSDGIVGNPQWQLCQFPMTNYHKPGTYPLTVQEARSLKSKCLQGGLLLAALAENPSQTPPLTLGTDGSWPSLVVLGWRHSGFHLHPCAALSSVWLCASFFASPRDPAIGFRAHPTQNDLAMESLPQWHLQQPFFQIRSCSQVPGLRALTCLLGITPLHHPKTFISTFSCVRFSHNPTVLYARSLTPMSTNLVHIGFIPPITQIWAIFF